MDRIFKKLNLKDHREVLVANAPSRFESPLLTAGGFDFTFLLRTFMFPPSCREYFQ